MESNNMINEYKIEFQKIELPFELEPNVSIPTIEIISTDVLLKFAIKGKKTDIGWEDGNSQILFVDCLMYRIGDPNDEGFYGVNHEIKNNTIYSKNNFPDLDILSFYKVVGLDWKNNLLGIGTEILNKMYQDKNGYYHFIIFMKDGTFECVSKDQKII